jgi:hypothetical protein
MPVRPNDNNDPYVELPDDPEQAFIFLEEHFRNECDNALKQADQNERVDIYYVRYISNVIAAIEALGIQAAFEREVPSIREVSWETYMQFSNDVEHYKTKLRIQHAHRTQGYSVRFDQAAKQKLRHYLHEMRAVVDALEVDEKKKNALYTRMNDLQSEIDRDRTRFDAVASLSIAAAGVLGEVMEKSQIRGLLNSIERVFWGAQSDAQQQLPAPPKPRQIEGPRTERASQGRTRPPQATAQKGNGANDLNDEVPF